MYLDRLSRPLVDWGAFPRVRVWRTPDINKVKKEDTFLLVTMARQRYVIVLSVVVVNV